MHSHENSYKKLPGALRASMPRLGLRALVRLQIVFLVWSLPQARAARQARRQLIVGGNEAPRGR